MTTFVDPFGITSTGKIGITSIAPNSSSTTSISRDAAWMVVVVNPTSDGAKASLPSSPQVGDFVEVYMQGTFINLFVYGAGTDTINGAANIELEPNQGRFFRCVASGTWVA